MVSSQGGTSNAVSLNSAPVQLSRVRSEPEAQNRSLGQRAAKRQVSFDDGEAGESSAPVMNKTFTEPLAGRPGQDPALAGIGSRRWSTEVAGTITASDGKHLSATYSNQSCTWSRQTSPHSGGWRKGIDKSLTPEAIRKLEELHDDFLAKSQGAPSLQVDATEAAIRKAYHGSQGSWQICAAAPPASEQPYSVRALTVHPASVETASSVLQRFGIGAVCTKGEKRVGDKAAGQDSMSVTRLVGNWDCLCVADGHGVSGDWVANRIAKTLPFFLSSIECRHNLLHSLLEDAGMVSGRSGKVLSTTGTDEDRPTRHVSTQEGRTRIQDMLDKLFSRAQQDVEAHGRDEQVELQMSGTTAACVLRRADASSVYVATVGDSRVVLMTPDGKVIKATTCHKPDEGSEERARVERMGCEVRTKVHDDGFVDERVVLEGYDFPLLAMTRSFGDLAVKEHGVTAEPEVLRWDVSEYEDCFLLIASDGVWEFLTPEEAAAIVGASLQANGGSGGSAADAAVGDLLKAARAQWEKHEGKNHYCDDTTVVLAPVTVVLAAAPVPSGADGEGCCAGVKCVVQ